MDQSNERAPNPGLAVMIVVPLLGPPLLSASLTALTRISLVPALIGSYLACLCLAPGLAMLANRLVRRERSHNVAWLPRIGHRS